MSLKIERIYDNEDYIEIINSNGEVRAYANSRRNSIKNNTTNKMRRHSSSF